MIPLRLKLSGFLSYREPVEVDFSGFDLACISGQNGAGKSSLLDAMTWALFGQARKRDESVINQQSKTAEVAFTFAYEQNTFRVIRRLPRGKTTMLEFQVWDDGRKTPDREPLTESEGQWRPLTEHSTRETQARIEKVLRLDYDTFINVSFFLQGRADQFAQQPPTRRKEILGNILGLETWEVYRERTAERRKQVEGHLEALDGRTAEIEAELAEEEPRKARLAELELQLGGLTLSRKAQETALAGVKQMRLGLDKRREMFEKMKQSLERSQGNLSILQTRMLEREAVRGPYANLVGRAAEVEASYAAWQQARRELEAWEGTASRFHEQEKQRFPFLDEINAERAKLEQEQRSLEGQAESLDRQSSTTKELEAKMETVNRSLKEAGEKLALKAATEAERQAALEKREQLAGENKSLFAQMQELDSRIKRLELAEGADCPLCGQPLSTEHRLATLEQLKAEGKQKGDTYRENKAAVEGLSARLVEYDRQISDYSRVEAERLALSNTCAQLGERLETMQKQAKEWEASGARRLEQVRALLFNEDFVNEARQKLARVDRGLATLGYEAVKHDAARRDELQRRTAEGAYRELEAARAALKPLEDEIANLHAQETTLAAEIAARQVEYETEAQALAEMEAQAPDLESAEQALFDSQECENRLNQEVGAARQKVTVLDDLRKRRKKFEAERGELGLQIGRYKTLERAFGKDGVPALLIEQALPEIEMKANEILGRLSDDSMHLHFETQAKYKDEKRKDLRETLEIQVSDGAGERDYEMFSGGEAFRVNFAIRLALSEVLAQRKGARLQMLVIDEGFGSQDTLGRQRLIQAINTVKPDFAKILVITHLDELKDAFPNRIEVEKTEAGSVVTVS